MSSLDPILEAKYEGYELAARQAREGKQIARPLGTWGRIAFMIVVFLAFALVALTSVWVVTQ